jgi:hypothetical protein
VNFYEAEWPIYFINIGGIRKIKMCQNMTSGRGCANRSLYAAVGEATVSVGGAAIGLATGAGSAGAASGAGGAAGADVGETWGADEGTDSVLGASTAGEGVRAGVGEEGAVSGAACGVSETGGEVGEVGSTSVGAEGWLISVGGATGGEDGAVGEADTTPPLIVIFWVGATVMSVMFCPGDVTTALFCGLEGADALILLKSRVTFVSGSVMFGADGPVTTVKLVPGVTVRSMEH